MKNFLLNPCGDLAIENGGLVGVDGGDHIRQCWLIRVRTYLGEWYLDASRGVPYVQEIFEKNVTEKRLKDIFRLITLGTPGIVRVNQVTIGAIDLADRSIDISVDATMDTGASDLFYYSGPLDPSACPISAGSDFPATLGDCRMWFDFSDPSTISYVVGSSLVATNKAATGRATAVFAGGYPLWAAGVNGLRCVSSDGTYASPAHLSVVDTPAIRSATNNSLTIAVVVKNDVTTSSTWHTLGLGGNTSSGTKECYYFRWIPRAAGVQTFNLWSERAGGASYSYSYDYTPADRTGKRIFVVEIDVPSLDVNFYRDGLYTYNTTLDAAAVRQLDGNGKILAGYAADCVTAAGSIDGQIGEVLVFSGLLGATNLAQLQSYLRLKWGF